MPPLLFYFWFLVVGTWGVVIAIWNTWAAGWGSRMQRIWGRAAAEMVTPRYVRFIGLVLAVFGFTIGILGLTGVLPSAA